MKELFLLVTPDDLLLQDFLMETFIMFKDLMGNVFPADWMVMNLVQMQVFLRAISQYSDVLNMYFLDQAHFHQQVPHPAEGVCPDDVINRLADRPSPAPPLLPCSCGTTTST